MRANLPASCQLTKQDYELAVFKSIFFGAFPSPRTIVSQWSFGTVSRDHRAAHCFSGV